MKLYIKVYIFIAILIIAANSSLNTNERILLCGVTLLLLFPPNLITSSTIILTFIAISCAYMLYKSVLMVTEEYGLYSNVALVSVALLIIISIICGRPKKRGEQNE